jgi:hypothetical protein
MRPRLAMCEVASVLIQKVLLQSEAGDDSDGQHDQLSLSSDSRMRSVQFKLHQSISGDGWKVVRIDRPPVMSM